MQKRVFEVKGSYVAAKPPLIFISCVCPRVDLTSVYVALLRYISVPTLASVGSETRLCWADPSFLEPDWTQCLR